MLDWNLSMAKKIFKGAGKILGVGKKKADPVAEPVAASGPVVKQLSPTDPALAKRRRQPSLVGSLLGGTDRLGG